NVCVLGLPPLVDCGDDVTPVVVPCPVFIPAGGSATIFGCELVSCPGLANHLTIVASAVANTNVPCVFDICGRVITTTNTGCSGAVECQTPATCRVTGGGQLIPGTSDKSCMTVTTTIFPNGTIDKITHGGQLGAPYSQM